VKDQDCEYKYRFVLEDGRSSRSRERRNRIRRETHTAANLFDALKEGYYGKF